MVKTAALLWNINCISYVKILITIIMQMVLLRKLSELFVTLWIEDIDGTRTDNVINAPIITALAATHVLNVFCML